MGGRGERHGARRWRVALISATLVAAGVGCAGRASTDPSGESTGHGGTGGGAQAGSAGDDSAPGQDASAGELQEVSVALAMPVDCEGAVSGTISGADCEWEFDCAGELRTGQCYAGEAITCRCETAVWSYGIIQLQDASAAGCQLAADACASGPLLSEYQCNEPSGNGTQVSCELGQACGFIYQEGSSSLTLSDPYHVECQLQGDAYACRCQRAGFAAGNSFSLGQFRFDLAATDADRACVSALDVCHGSLQIGAGPRQCGTAPIEHPRSDVCSTTNECWVPGALGEQRVRVLDQVTRVDCVGTAGNFNCTCSTGPNSVSTASSLDEACLEAAAHCQ